MANDPSQLGGKVTRLLFDHWLTLGSEGLIPNETEFDILQCSDFLSTLVVFDLVDSGADIQSSFYGSLIADFFQLEDQKVSWNEIKETFSEIPNLTSLIKNLETIFSSCISERAPIANGPKRLEWKPKNFITFESLSVPFANSQNEVTRIACVFDIEISLNK